MIVARHGGHHLLHRDQALTFYSVFLKDSVQLTFEDMVVFRQLYDPGLQQHIIQPPLLSGPLGCLIVTTSSVPVGIIFFVFRNKFTLLPLIENILPTLSTETVVKTGAHWTGTTRKEFRVL